MEPWMLIFFRFYGLFLLSAFLLFLAGRSLLHLLSPLLIVRGFYQKIFFSIALGMFTAVIISSVIQTRFITVSWGFLLVGFFLIIEFLQFKKIHAQPFQLTLAKNNSSAITISRITELLLISFFFFSWSAFMIFKSGSFPFVVPERDYIYYADLSENLWRTGQENYYQAGNLVSTVFHGTIPYHYFELWLQAFFSWLFNEEPLLTEYLVVFPLFFLMMALGAYALAESITALSRMVKISLFMMLFFGAIPFITDNSSDYFEWLTVLESPLFIEKISAPYWIALIASILLINNFYTAGFLVFISLIFVSAAILPGIVIGACGILVLSFIMKWQSRAVLLKQVFYLACVLLFFFSFYAVSGNMNFSFRTVYPLIYYTDLSPVLEQGWDFFTIKVALIEMTVRIYKMPLELILWLSPYLILILFMWKSTVSDLKVLRLPFFFLLFAYFGSLVLYGFFYKMYDSGQFVEGVYFLIFLFILIAIIMLMRASNPRMIRIAFAAIAFIFILKVTIYSLGRINQKSVFKEKYSDEYLTAISLSDLENSSLPGICFRELPGKNRITGRNTEIANRLGGYTGFLPQYSQTVNLNLIEMSDWDYGRWGELEKIIVQTSPFYQYVEEQKKAGRFVSIGKSQLDFIDDHNIAFAIAEKNVEVPELILQRVKKTITDFKSGERFMLLD